ncbi:MAG: alpha/beta hydrolase, partial [Arenimonas sp.]|nr:alpha/beta hydrolase [Arenimonas sp.]
FAPVLFSYSTLWQSPDSAMEQLAGRLAAFGDGPVHMLAHSLGGLIAAETLNRHPDLPAGRLVCLGSPIAGSAAARGLAQRRLAWISGKSGAFLREGLARLPPGREVGMIAGARSMGLGKFFGGLEGDNDGTVAISETRLPGLAEHVVVAASHSGLIVSAQAAELAGNFLETGHFSR